MKRSTSYIGKKLKVYYSKLILKKSMIKSNALLFKIKVNDNIDHYFQTLKGLRLRDPLSPIIFNLAADVLAVLVARTKQDGQVGGLIPHFVGGGVSVLQYADDIILFLT